MRKTGKKLTKEHKILLEDCGYDPSDWLIQKNTPSFKVFVHRETGETLTI